MDQRHQVYVIARAGSQYRVLAAVDCPQMFGSTAVNFCLRLLRTFTHPSNLPDIRRELGMAEILNWNKDIWVDEHRTRAHEALFSTIAKYLLTNAPTAQHGPRARPSLIPINWHFDGQEILNDDWITIFDITEPGYARYAFMHPDNNTLVDARAYLQAFQSSPPPPPPPPPSPPPPSSDFDALLQFNLVSPNAVRSTWPGYDFKVKLECDAWDLKVLFQHL